jgi:hypothetical protein
MLSLKNPKQTLQRMHSLIGGLCDQLNVLCREEEEEEARATEQQAIADAEQLKLVNNTLVNSGNSLFSLDEKSVSSLNESVVGSEAGSTPMFDDSVFDQGTGKTATGGGDSVPPSPPPPPHSTPAGSVVNTPIADTVANALERLAECERDVESASSAVTTGNAGASTTAIAGIAFSDHRQQNQAPPAQILPFPPMPTPSSSGNLASQDDGDSAGAASLRGPTPVKLLSKAASADSMEVNDFSVSGADSNANTQSGTSTGLTNLVVGGPTNSSCSSSSPYHVSTPGTPTPGKIASGTGNANFDPSLSGSNDSAVPAGTATVEEMDNNLLADRSKSKQQLQPSSSASGATLLKSARPPFNSSCSLVSLPNTPTPFPPTPVKPDSNSSASSNTSTQPPNSKSLYLGETIHLMADRWEKLYKDFYSAKAGMYDLSKVPDVYDSIRYEMLHNSHLPLTGMQELFDLATKFENTVVPQEYGTVADDKRRIGSMMCNSLLEKIKHDLLVSRSGGSGDLHYMLDSSHASHLEINSINRAVRSRLYFTSESHLYTLLNVLRYSPEGEKKAFCDGGHAKLDDVSELSYLTQVVFRLFQKKTVEGEVSDNNDVNNFRVEISFSPGAIYDPNNPDSCEISPYFLLNKSIPCDQLLECLENAITACDIRSGAPTPTADSPMEHETAKFIVTPGVLASMSGKSIRADGEASPENFGDAATNPVGPKATAASDGVSPFRQSSGDRDRINSSGSNSSTKANPPGATSLSGSPYASGANAAHLSRAQSHRKLASSGITVVKDEPWNV